MFQPSTLNWNPIIRLEWTNTANSIGLRFPNVLDYNHVWGDGIVTNAMIHGSMTGHNATSPGIFTPPSPLPPVLRSQAREEFVYQTYFAGEVAAAVGGQALRLAAWLVPPDPADVPALHSAALAARNSYRISWGGWEWPAERHTRPPVMQVPMADRWEAGVEVLRVDTSTGLPSPTGDAVQVITKGFITRFWEKEFFSPRHIMIDFLARIAIPAGQVAPWQDQMQRAIQFFPFENFRENRVWNGHTLLGVDRDFIYSGTLANVANLVPVFTTPAPTPTFWRPRHSAANVSKVNRGRNHENVSAIDVTYRFNYAHVPITLERPTLDVRTNAAEISTSIRANAAQLGLNMTGPAGNAGNSTARGYSAWDQDVLLKALRAYNTYYRTFQVPCPSFGSGLYGDGIKQVRADTIAGGTYAIDFAILNPDAGNATTVGNPPQRTRTGIDGRMIATGGWGGRGSLHAYNERVEIDAMVDHGKRTARVFAEFAAGVPHTWSVAGAPRPNHNALGSAVPELNNFQYKGFWYKGYLYYSIHNDVVHGVYIEEESVATNVIRALTDIPANETVEILFARKFKMVNLTGEEPGLTLTTTLINPDGSLLDFGTVYMYARAANMDDLDAGAWTRVAVGTEGEAIFKFLDGSIFDQSSASREVEVSVIALVVTDGASGVIKPEPPTTPTPTPPPPPGGGGSSGCNAGYAFGFLALMLIPFVIRKKK